MNCPNQRAHEQQSTCTLAIWQTTQQQELLPYEHTSTVSRAQPEAKTKRPQLWLVNYLHLHLHLQLHAHVSETYTTIIYIHIYCTRTPKPASHAEHSPEALKHRTEVWTGRATHPQKAGWEGGGEVFASLWM